MFRGVISREQWGAAPPTGNNGEQYFDEGAILHWEGPKMWGDLWAFAHDSCYEKVRGIQRYHQTHGYSDIAYNDVICPHGYIFNGRSGIPMANAASGSSWINRHAPAVCFLWGTDDNILQDNPDPIDALHAWRNFGIGFAGMSWQVRGHQQIVATSCPGGELMWVAGLLNNAPPQPFNSGDGTQPAPSPNPPPAPTDPILRVGSTGPAVSDWQAWLNQWTQAGLAVDGDFGPLTEAAVRRFQEFWHGHNPEIVVDGIIGPQTWDLRRFTEYLASRPPEPEPTPPPEPPAPEPEPTPPPVPEPEPEPPAPDPYFSDEDIFAIMTVVEQFVRRQRKREKIEKALREL